MPELEDTQEVVEDVSGEDGYSPEEMEMFRVDDTDDEEVEEVDSVEDVDDTEEADEIAPDRWEELKAKYDPDKLEHTYTTFTKKLEEERSKVRAELDSVAEYKTVIDEIKTDPALQAHIREYFEKGPTPIDELKAVKSQMQTMQQNLQIKEELASVKAYVEAEGLPVVEDRELLEFAAKSNAPDLSTAYRAMTYDMVRAQAEEKAFDKVKKSKGASIPKVGPADTSKGQSLSQSDIDKMSNEEFEKRYDEVTAFYARGKRR